MGKQDRSYGAIVKGLGIEDSFLERYKTNIADGFANALLVTWSGLKGVESGLSFRMVHMFGVNQCFHLASSIIMLCGDMSRFKEMMEWLVPLAEEKNTDAHSMLLAAVLAYTLDAMERGDWQLSQTQIREELKRVRPRQTPKDYSIAGVLRSRFIDTNWMIGRFAAQAIGLPC